MTSSTAPAPNAVRDAPHTSARAMNIAPRIASVAPSRFGFRTLADTFFVVIPIQPQIYQLITINTVTNLLTRGSGRLPSRGGRGRALPGGEERTQAFAIGRIGQAHPQPVLHPGVPHPLTFGVERPRHLAHGRRHI